MTAINDLLMWPGQLQLWLSTGWPQDQFEEESTQAPDVEEELEAIIGDNREEEKVKALEVINRFPGAGEACWAMMDNDMEMKAFTRLIRAEPNNLGMNNGLFSPICKKVRQYLLRKLATLNPSMLRQQDSKTAEELSRIRMCILWCSIPASAKPNCREEDIIADETMWKKATTSFTKIRKCLSILHNDESVHNVLMEFYEKTLREILEHAEPEITRAQEWFYAYATFSELYHLEREWQT